MTEDMDLPSMLTANVVELANAIYRAVERSKDVVYFRRIWNFIMLILRNIPENIFKNLKI